MGGFDWEQQSEREGRRERERERGGDVDVKKDGNDWAVCGFLLSLRRG